MTDRGNAAAKLHLAGEAGGLPLSVVLTSANASDSRIARRMVDSSSHAGPTPPPGRINSPPKSLAGLAKDL